MKKKLVVFTSLFAAALALSSCTPSTGPASGGTRADEPSTNKVYSSPVELINAKKVDSTGTIDGKTFTVKTIGPVSDKADSLPKVSGNTKNIGVTYENNISAASAASASVDGMPQELIGVSAGTGTIVVSVPEGAQNAYALITFGSKGALSINMLDGKVTVKPPVTTSNPAQSSSPSSVPSGPNATTVPVVPVPVATAPVPGSYDSENLPKPTSGPPAATQPTSPTSVQK